MKQALRTQIREKRKAISPDLYAKKSAAIREKLEKMPEFQAAKNLLVYVSTNEEVDTHAIIKDCLASGKKIYAPKVEGEHIFICRITDWEQLKPGSFGILEPCEILDPAHPEIMDLILVPGIAFDKRGHRIGYGKGFYDSMLKAGNGLKVGLAFSEQMVDEIPDESHDVSLDLVITDTP